MLIIVSICDMKNSLLKNLYKLAWFGIIPVFTFFFFINSKMCFVSCTGDDEMALWYGLLAAGIYLVLLEFIKIIGIRFYLHKQTEWVTTFHILIIPLIVIAYALGKVSVWQ